VKCELLPKIAKSLGYSNSAIFAHVMFCCCGTWHETSRRYVGRVAAGEVRIYGAGLRSPIGTAAMIAFS
jgi:hypothetical protein